MLFIFPAASSPHFLTQGFSLNLELANRLEISQGSVSLHFSTAGMTSSNLHAQLLCGARHLNSRTLGVALTEQMLLLTERSPQPLLYI